MDVLLIVMFAQLLDPIRLVGMCCATYFAPNRLLAAAFSAAASLLSFGIVFAIRETSSPMDGLSALAAILLGALFGVLLYGPFSRLRQKRKDRENPID